MNNIIRQCKGALLLLTLISLPCAAFSKVPAVPEDKPKWRIGVTAPSFYPIYVSQAYGVNEREDWTSLVFSIDQLLNRIELSSVKQWIPHYDGFGIALNPLTSFSREQIGGTNHLPDSVYVYWTSMHDLKFYATKLDLSDKIKAMMLRKRQVMLKTKYISCYMNDFIFGLLPNGRAKVWLYGCGEYTYIAELAAFKILQQDYQGVKAVDLGDTTEFFQSIEKQANDLGENLFPIPWDKVNKVYKKENYTIDSIDDYNDQGELINLKPAPVPPKPEKITYRCWADKPPATKTPLKIDYTSPAHLFQQTLWEYSPNLVNPVRDIDSTMNDAWSEATQQKLDEDHTQAWVLARLVGLTDYPLDKLYKELKIPTYGQRYIERYLEQMCQSQ